MDRNQIIGIALISVIIIAFMIWMQPSKEQLAKQKQKKDSLELVEIKKLEEEKKKKQEQNISSDTVKVITDDMIAEKILNTQDTTLLDSLNKKLYDLYGQFAEAAVGKEDFYTIENDLIKVKISNKGGRVVEVELKNYKTHNQTPLILFDGPDNLFHLDFFADNKLISTKNFYFETTDDKNINATSSQKQLVMRLYADTDKYIDYVYTLKPNSYILDFDIKFNNVNDIIAKNSNYIELTWQTNLKSLERGDKPENMNTLLFYKYYEDAVEQLTEVKDDQKTLSTRVQWIGYKHQFFASVLIAKKYFDNAKVSQINEPGDSILKTMASKISLTYKGAAKETVPMAFYFGPNQYKILNNIEIAEDVKLDMQEMIPLGGNIFRAVNVYVVIPLFNFLGKYFASFGLIILILTIIIKTGLFPLTYKSFLSSAKMRVLKPQIDEINARIPADKPMDRQQATMALYRKVGVSPMGGCLPVLFQFPILVAMFRFFPASIELRQQGFLWATDLSSYDAIVSWETEIPFISSLYGNHISLFTLLMAVAILISTLMNSSQLQGNNPQMAGMKLMMYLMPVMMIFWFNNYSSGLSYYYLLSNIITIGQTFLMRRFVNEEALLKKLNENAKKNKEPQKSKFQQRIEEMSKQRQLYSKKK